MKFSTNLHAALLGSPAKVKVLEFFLVDGRPISENGLAERIGFSQPAVSKVLKGFKELNIIESTRIGNANVWSLNPKGYMHEVIQMLVPFFRSPKTPFGYLLTTLRNYLVAMQKVHFNAAYVFGSVARGGEGQYSDVDLLIIVETKKDKEIVENSLTDLRNSIYQNFNTVLSPVIVTSEEAGQLAWIRNKEDFVRL